MVERLRLGDRPVRIAGDVTGDRDGDDQATIVGCGGIECRLHGIAGGPGAHVGIVLIVPIAAGVRGVRFPVVAGPTIAAEAVERDRIVERRAVGKIDAVDVRRDCLDVLRRVHRELHGAAAGLSGVMAA